MTESEQEQLHIHGGDHEETYYEKRIIGLANLPNKIDAPHDPTLDRDALLDRLTVWLMKERTFRTDTGTPITTTFFRWACGIEPGGDSWLQCFTAPVFARTPDDSSIPRVIRTSLPQSAGTRPHEWS